MNGDIMADIMHEILSIEVIQFDGQISDLEELVNPEELEEIISKYIYVQPIRKRKEELEEWS